MGRVFNFIMALGLAASFAQFPLTSYAEEEVKKEAEAKTWERVCEEAKITSKNREASDEDRAEAKAVYKECKKEARKRKRAQCVPTGSRLNRC
ncbi:MAG: hypothetical protein ACTSU8_02050 [Alphaproteobacteria bacterium]